MPEVAPCPDVKNRNSFGLEAPKTGSLSLLHG